jgi:hypothetical protein
MKHTFMKSCVAALAIAALVSLVRCDNNLTDQGVGGTVGGTVEIQIRTPEARTLYPALVFTKYVLSFTGPGSETHESVALTDGNASASIELALGAWTIDATAYTGTGSTEQETAQGSVDVTVLETGPVQAYIILGPIPGTETGTFSYAITLPVGASAAQLFLTDAATGTAAPGSPIDLTGGSSGTLDLAPGSYLMQIQLTKAGGETTGLAEAVHIYAGLTTSVTLDGDDLSAVPLSELAAHLATLAANTAETPYTVILGPSIIIDTADTNANGIWATINSTVQTAGKYVILGLSACTAVDNAIAGGNPVSTNNHFNIIRDNTYIKGITLPSTLTSIGYSAFTYCSGLTSLTIPDGVTTIGNSAFSNCSNLTAFTVEESNTAYSAQDGILYNKAKTTIISVPGAKSGALSLPNTLTSIGDGAFSGCSGLTSVTIPDGLTSIGDIAFSTCSGLTSVTLPNGVTTIRRSTFYGCSDLTSLTIPGSVTTIENGAFWDCSGLTSVTIPGSVTSIGDGAFSDCSGLTSVTIPDSVTSIGDRAFSRCSGLTSVTILGSVTSIGNYAFAGCSGLTSVIFGAESNITTEWDNDAFGPYYESPSGTSLWNAYTAGTKAGTYTRVDATWTQE